jgi:hypothetical protein
MDKRQKSAFDDEIEVELPDHIPLNKPVTDQMKIDLVTNKKGQLWVLHNKRFNGYLDYIEYEAKERRLIFITKDGRLNDFNLEIGDQMHKRLVKGTKIDVMLMQDKKIRDFAPIPLIVRTTTH